MSNEPSVIVAKNLIKKYKLYNRPSDRLREALHPSRKKYHHEYSALNGMSFEVFKGQCLGIIGKNGSGKSTLLKILSGVITPTSGTLTVEGKVSALLELGAGFNPELSGRENIYLNGSLMGYEDREIDLKVPEILDFAGIGEYIEQPVKMYSSGMYARLAFAIAINVDPDILIIDETLSVGDIQFQQKCFRRLREFSEAKKTVLFVGHDLAAINTFCDRCIWINEGKIAADGAAKDITKEYSSYMFYGHTTNSGAVEPAQAEVSWNNADLFDSFGDGEAKFTELRIATAQGNLPSSLQGGEELFIDLKIESLKKIENPIIGFLVKNHLGNHVFGGNTLGHEVNFAPIEPGKSRYQIGFRFPNLSNGQYTVSTALAEGSQRDHVQKHWVHDWAVLQVSNHKIRYQIGDGLVLENCFSFKQM